MAIQITGAAADIERILANKIIREGRPHDRGGLHWIEVNELSDEDFRRIGEFNGKVHDPSRLT